MILQVLIAMIAGWINRHQQQVITYQQEEIRILKAKLGDQHIRLTDAERHRLVALAFPIDRKRLKSLATLATPAPKRRQGGLSVMWCWRRYLPLYRALGVLRHDDSYHQSRPRS